VCDCRTIICVPSKVEQASTAFPPHPRNISAHSRRYGYHWKEAEGERNLLRTHTTAVSSRMLFKLAQSGFRPAKLFSVDRVFRNEAIDRTHLAEFHQIEGLVCDRGLTLGDLIGTLHAFFERLGLKKLRFKPAFNPYTEPSMEIFRCARACASSRL
jgi:phenylalanyl-tRNA synthetase alpha chain